MIDIALPKGRLGERAYGLFERCGRGCEEIRAPGRRLVFENPQAGVRFFWVKPSDVPIYVERGAADLGVAGKDVLLEHAADVYELLDLGIGRCAMCVAGPKGWRAPEGATLRVATKFPGIARRHYAQSGRAIDIIKLNGSIELAPILGLTDVIVDIVETGKTLEENDLSVVTEIEPSSARLIANKSSYQFERVRIEAMVEQLKGLI